VNAADDRLERRCRRLLWAYPSTYRSERGEEIVGVLLDAARPGQTRPSLRDSGDLVRAGLVARAATARASYTWSPWRDAVALVSVLLPLALAARLVLWVSDAADLLRFGSTGLAPWYVASVAYGGVTAVLWVVVALAVVTRHLSAARVWAAAATAAQACLVVRMAMVDSAFWAFGPTAVLALEVVATLLLMRRSDVQRGLDLAGPRILIAALVGFMLVTSDRVTWLTHDDLEMITPIIGWSVLAWVLWSRRRVLMERGLGLRLAVAGVVLAGVGMITRRIQRAFNVGGHATMKDLVTLLVLCLLWAAAVVVATALTSVLATRLWKRRPA
jgi:hypothetical protein